MLEAASRVGGWAHSLRYEDGSVFELGPRSFRLTGNAGYNTICLVCNEVFCKSVRFSFLDNSGAVHFGTTIHCPWETYHAFLHPLKLLMRLLY